MPLSAEDVPPHVTTEFRPFVKSAKDSLTSVPVLYEWHAKNNPKYPLFTYYDGKQREYIAYSTAYTAIGRAARYIASGLDQPAPPVQPGADRPVVGIFATADSITYLCTAIGVLKSGCVLFLISNRNGPAGIADMLQRTGTTQLLVSRDSIMRETAEDALSRLPPGQVTMRDMPTFEDLFPGNGKATNDAFEADVELPKTYDIDAWAMILHSSGSTGHPKTIWWTHKHMATFASAPVRSGANISRHVLGAHGTPMYHGLGAFLYGAAATCGFVIGAFKPAFPPIFPTPDTVWEAVVKTKSDFTWSVPSFIEEWARDPEKVTVMKRMSGLLFGGAPLSKEAGDSLASRGVNLFSVYGLTEAGAVTHLMRPNPGMDWEYVSPLSYVEIKYIPAGDNVYELVVLSSAENPLPVVNTTVNGREGYATKDLIEFHPSNPKLWRVYGRADEQIMLSNGEKTNPLPLEKIINEDPHVNASVMFGRGKFQNGILVEPKEEFKVDPRDPKQIETFRNLIWPSVERANQFAPQHSRIFKEMILVASPLKPLQLNMKRLPRRPLILKDYHNEIEALYQEVENSSQGDLLPPAAWDKERTHAFIRAVVERTLRRSIADDADIFRNGGDSLQATWIRNTVMRAIRQTDVAAARRIPTTLVFKAPTISGLTDIVYNSIHNADTTEDGIARSPEELWKYVAKYSADLPARPANLVDRPNGGQDVVLITGTTGGFGCDALEHLLRDGKVERVYAFNRKGTNALERQHAQFRARGLDEALLDTPKFKMVEAVLHEPGFGIDVDLLDEVRRSVTHILHNAWKVDFNISLSSFGVDLQGARNLVDLAISSPYKVTPTILFVSSIGVFMGYKGSAPAPEAALDDPSTAFGVGYQESKWVTEHVLENVTRQTGVHTISMRLGQVSGNKVGYWNEKEWFPAIVKSAQFQRCLPDIDGVRFVSSRRKHVTDVGAVLQKVSWIPGYESAKAFVEMRSSSEPFLHLVHPRPVPWHDLIAPIAKELGVTLVPYPEWLSALEKSVGGKDGMTDVKLMKANPALRILDFFKALKMGEPDREPLGIVYLSTEKATKASETLANLPLLNAESARGWLAAWKDSGFIGNM
ncbi:acetyl-CoA synthetase-like protein [Trametes sanguinea]|nr:acetyl-CoA synthetase-like protein [Trametes sanguinea]